jgi:hypothetical protein
MLILNNTASKTAQIFQDEGIKTGRWSVKGCVPTLERWNDKRVIESVA